MALVSEAKWLPLRILEGELIRGNQELVRRELRRLSRGKLPRSNVAHLAELAIRANLAELAIEILHPFLRVDRIQGEEPTELELAVYAGALIRVGAFLEGEARLEDLSPSRCPIVLFYQVMALVAQWRYGETIPLLKKYLELEVPEYQGDVARVNLAGALTFERKFAEADSFLDELRFSLKKKKEQLLYGAALMFSAQNSLRQEHWSKTRAYLDEARKIQLPSGGLEAMFWRKWEGYFQVLTKGKRHLAALRKIREEALGRRHWETVRDIDRMECLVLRDENLYLHLWFGTPHEEFKRWLAADFPGVDTPEIYERSLGSLSKESRTLSLIPSEKSNEKFSLAQRTLMLLNLDFYRPTRVAHLFHLLAPGEFFHPQAAPARVYSAVTRVRAWLKRNRYPLEISEEDGAYRLFSSKGIILRTQAARETNRLSWQLSRLNGHFGETNFQVADAAQVLRVSPRTAGRILEFACQEKKIAKEGKARATRYRFSKCA